MIEFFVTGDFNVIQSQVYIILAMCAIMVLAVCIDLWAGTDSAKARGEKIYSGGLRRTFSKLGDYWRIQVMALIFDLIGSCIDWYTLPFASMLVTAAGLTHSANLPVPSLGQDRKSTRLNSSHT